METIIDIGLVKEQLRLLGHEVADDVILEFVKGLNRGPACQKQELSAATSSSDVGTAVDSRQPGDSDAALSRTREAQQQGEAAAAVQTQQQKFPWRGHTDSDAAPSKLQQAPDQQSPKRIAAGAGGVAVQERDSPPAASMLQRAALDQRCRNFLARCSEKPSPQHLMHSKDQQQQQQQQPQQQHRPQQALLLQVPRPQQQQRQPAAAGSSDLLSTSGSSELLLEEAAAGDDSPDDADSVASVGAQPYAAGRVLPAPPAQELSASNRWGQQQSQQQLLQAQLHAELAEEGGSSSDSDGSSTALEAEGSKFLMHQAATMQRVRARLAAKMAGYTAVAAASSSQPHQAPQAAAGAVDVAAAAQPATAARAAAAAAIARLKIDAASRGATGTTINSSLPVAAEAADASSSELPRFGFRPGYKPLGVHMPPPPSTAAVEALAASRALRQQAPAGAATATALGMMGTASLAAAAQHRLDMPLCMHSLTSALQQHQQQQQQQQQQWQVQSRPEPVVVPVGVSACSNGAHLGGSPGKPAGAGAVCRSSGSIIGGETPPCKAAAGGKSRQSPRADPLYLAPSSPRRSNPATPRSSPARSPAPVAPLSAAAVSLGLVRSPAGTAPAAAVTGPAGRGSSKQGLSFSAGSKGMQGRSGAQLQQASAVGMRRASSAPATPAAAAPPASVRSSGAGFGSSSAGGGGTGGSSSYTSRSRSAASHESLYCQRLAYSNQRSAVAPGVRKTDRVARFQQMQQQWQRDRFLCSGAGGAAAKKASGQHNHV